MPTALAPGVETHAIEALYCCMLGRFPTKSEKAVDLVGKPSAVALAVQIIESREFQSQVFPRLLEDKPFEGRFGDSPRAGFTAICADLLELPADMVLVATWKEWLVRLFQSDFGARALPDASDQLREAADLRWRTARAWRRVPAPPAAIDYDQRSAEDRLLTSGLFDPKWYSAQNPDIGSQEPARHFLDNGFREGRAPAPHFDLTSYLNENPDVRHSGINGVFHWMEYGLREGRRPPFSPGTQMELGLRLADLCDPDRVERWEREFDEDFRVSILTPTFNTDPRYLRELYTSLVNQKYSNWEWVICDDGSSKLETIATLHEIAARDSRVNIGFLEKGGGISKASNAALQRVSGHMIALVDHDDLLPRDTLHKVWQAWKIDRSCELFYTDECKLSLSGRVYDVYLKPDWSPVLLESTMYVAHLSVYSRSLMERAGGFRSAFDGTQDFDLMLRASRLIERAVHVDVIGYIWRAIPGSTATALDEKQWAVRRQQAAVSDHACALSKGAIVRPAFAPGHWRVTYPLPEEPPLLSYVIPTGAGSRRVWGQSVDLITNVIRSLVAQKFYPNFEIVVVHNGDLSEEQLTFIGTIPDVKLILFEEPALNLARKINMGVAASRGDYVCIMNDDVEIVTEKGGEELVAFMLAHPQVGAIGPLCLFEDGRVQHNGVMLIEQGPSHSGIFQAPGAPSHFNYLRMRREAFGVTGALLVTRRDLYTELGGFTESFPLNYNDVDFCQKIRDAGYSCVVDPEVVVYHFESATKVGTFKCEKEALFQRWPALSDPYFNRNFDQRDPSYRLPLHKQVDRREDFERWLDRRIGVRTLDRSASEANDPFLTVAVSIFDQPKSLLAEMLVSVLMQTYRSFELVIVDNGSTRRETLDWIAGLGVHDNVRVVRLEHNAGIAGGQRVLLGEARGKYFLPIDSDDFLTIDALEIIAAATARHPDSVIFYSDEFKSNVLSEKFSPFFKTEFDPIKIFNCCFTGHLMAFDTAYLRVVGAYEDDRATWCHDWDSTMRALVDGQVPVHIPELLYGWRINPGSTASALTGAKPEAVRSQRLVLERTLAAQGHDDLFVEPNCIGVNTGMWRVRAKRPLAGIASIDAAWLWGRPFEISRQLLEMLLAQSDRPSWIAILLSAGETKGVLTELSVPPTLNPNVGVSSGIIVDRKRNVVWSGGYLDGEHLSEPTVGQALVEGGYHGQLFCQRCIDVAPAGNVLIRTDAMAEALSRIQANFSPSSLMLELAIAGREGGWLTTTTPHAEALLPHDLNCIIPVDRENRVASAGMGDSPWGNGNLLREQFR